MKDAKGHGSVAHGEGIERAVPRAPDGHQGNDFHRRAADAQMQDEIVRGNVQLRANAAEWARRGLNAAAAGNYDLASNLMRQAADTYARLRMKP